MASYGARSTSSSSNLSRRLSSSSSSWLACLVFSMKMLPLLLSLLILSTLGTADNGMTAATTTGETASEVTLNPNGEVISNEELPNSLREKMGK
jgi:hypothetical protein